MLSTSRTTYLSSLENATRPYQIISHALKPCCQRWLVSCSVSMDVSHLCSSRWQSPGMRGVSTWLLSPKICKDSARRLGWNSKYIIANINISIIRRPLSRFPWLPHHFPAFVLSFLSAFLPPHHAYPGVPRLAPPLFLAQVHPPQHRRAHPPPRLPPPPSSPARPGSQPHRFLVPHPAPISPPLPASLAHPPNTELLGF